MHAEFDIVVVGGGLYGCTCAYFLAGENRRVLLVEKNRAGSSGATGYSRGIVRVYDPDPDLAEISLQGVNDLLNWEKNKFPGLNPYYAKGFLYLLDAGKEAEAQQAIAQWGHAGYPMELLSAKTVADRFPWLKYPEGKIGLYEKNGGYGDPRLTAQNFLEGFRRKGGVIYENCALESMEPNAQGWQLNLPFGPVKAQTVVLAMGAHTHRFVPELPLFTRSIPLTQVSGRFTGERLALVDESVETFMRPGDDSSFYCGSYVTNDVPFPEDLPCRLNEVRPDALNRIRKVVAEEVEAFNAFMGYDSYTNEKRPITQFVPNMPGVYVAAGFSGRGYKCGIPIGRQMAAEVNAHIGGTGNGSGSLKWRITV